MYRDRVMEAPTGDDYTATFGWSAASSADHPSRLMADGDALRCSLADLHPHEPLDRHLRAKRFVGLGDDVFHLRLGLADHGFLLEQDHLLIERAEFAFD